MTLRTLRTLALLGGVFALGMLTTETQAQALLCRNADASAVEGRALNCLDGTGVMYGAVGFNECGQDGCHATLWASYSGACPGSALCTAVLDGTTLGPVPSDDPDVDNTEEAQIPAPARMSIFCVCE
jgi:hypothetical protein